MKTRKFSFLVLLIFAAASTFFSSCKKDNSKQDSTSETSVDRNSITAERTFNDIGNYSITAMSAGKSMLKSGQTVMNPDAGCLQITFDLTAKPYKMILDFGTTNCMCEDGLNRHGKIIVAASTGFGDSLATLTTKLQDFYVNDNQVKGTSIFTNNGYNQSAHLNWDVTVDGSIVLANAGGTITYQATHNTELVAGENTLDLTDNVFSITGSSSGTAITGQVFSALVTSPLISKMTCKYFVSGMVDVTPVAEPVRTLNYSSGDCDNKATVTVSGITFDITLP